MDPDVGGPKLLGCVAVLLEEDETRQSDMVFGRIAYTKEMEKQLNDLMRKRIQANDRSSPSTRARRFKPAPSTSRRSRPTGWVRPAGGVPPFTVVTDRYVLSGEVSVAPVPWDTVDMRRPARVCRGEEA